MATAAPENAAKRGEHAFEQAKIIENLRTAQKNFPN